jgi:hypothetical protein
MSDIEGAKQRILDTAGKRGGIVFAEDFPRPDIDLAVNSGWLRSLGKGMFILTDKARSATK